MSGSARFAETDLPSEVEELLSGQDSSPTCTAAAGYAVVASANSNHALIFAIAAGSGLDPVAVPFQGHLSGHSPSLCAWPADASAGTPTALGVAILTKDAVLRVYRSVNVRRSIRQRFDQVRVGSALARSVGAEEIQVDGLEVVRSLNGNLYVFGERGSAAVVSLTGTKLEVRALRGGRDVERGSLRLGNFFNSAIRSIGVRSPWGAGVERAEVLHEIVSCAATNKVDSVICLRRGGVIERWGEGGQLWSFNLFDLHEGRDGNRRVLSADVTSDDTVVVLVQSTDFTTDTVGHEVVTFDIRSADDIPNTVEMTMPLNAEQDVMNLPCVMALSGDIAYLYVPGAKVIAWLSVAKGVPSEGQVQGSINTGMEVTVQSIVNASFGLHEASATGGIAAVIHNAGVWLVSSAVPAPISVDRDCSTPVLTSIDDVVPIFWRSFLQYCADQKGAAKASLHAMVNSLQTDGFDVAESLSELVKRISRKIITSEYDPNKALTSLLIDTELKKKEDQHRRFLRLLADSEMFSEVRPDAPSTTEDYIWNAISVSARCETVSDGEKLSSARRVRELENRCAKADYFPPFNEASSTSLLSGQIRGDGAGLFVRDDMGDRLSGFEVPRILSEAFSLAGSEISKATFEGGTGEPASQLYHHPHEFHRFLPALNQCLSNFLSKSISEQNVMGDSEAVDVGIYRWTARNAVLLSCETVIEVVKGSRESRESALELFESLPGAMKGVQNWMSDMNTFGHIMMKIAQKALDLGARTRQAVDSPLFYAATTVIDELLSRTPFDEFWKYSRDGVKANHTAKRRRLALELSGTVRGNELRTAIGALRRSGLDDQAFRLADKYGDYAAMISLKMSSTKFDEFMEQSLEKFGDHFALFAFKWLEDRGQLRLLLRGQKFETDGNVKNSFPSRSERMNQLLSDYFRDGRRTFSNLAWIHWMSVGDPGEAAQSLVEQTKYISVPGKKGSALNSGVLSSIAKLAMHACGDSGHNGASKSVASDYVSGRLILNKLQEIIEPGENTLRCTDDLIRRFIEESPTASDTFAGRVVMANEALQYSAVSLEEMQTLQDYIWKRCVERQVNIWMSIVEKMTSASDMEMRENLMDTALYKAATQLTLTKNKFGDMMARGVFVDSEFVKQNCLREVTSLLNAVVSLTAE